jgi:hypothetical protein
LAGLVAATAGASAHAGLGKRLPDMPRFKLLASSHSTAAAQVLAFHGVKISRFASSKTTGGLGGARDEHGAAPASLRSRATRDKCPEEFRRGKGRAPERRPQRLQASAAGPLCQAALYLPQVVLIGGLEGRIYRCDCGKDNHGGIVQPAERAEDAEG